MVKRLSTRGIKRHRIYTYEDAADCLGVTPQTVRSWRNSGLDVMASQRPHLILGAALIDFVQRQRTKARQELARDQLYCLSCRAPVRPWGMAVDYVPITPSRGCLKGLCERCNGCCNRFVAKGELPDLEAIFEIAARMENQAYTNPASPSQNITSSG